MPLQLSSLNGFLIDPMRVELCRAFQFDAWIKQGGHWGRVQLTP
jgi:hypothetical protein